MVRRPTGMMGRRRTGFILVDVIIAGVLLGIALATVREHAVAGLDFISVGAVTHSAPALDLSLLLEPSP